MTEADLCEEAQAYLDGLRREAPTWDNTMLRLTMQQTSYEAMANGVWHTTGTDRVIYAHKALAAGMYMKEFKTLQLLDGETIE